MLTAGGRRRRRRRQGEYWRAEVQLNRTAVELDRRTARLEALLAPLALAGLS